jgi:hypothetical protein
LRRVADNWPARRPVAPQNATSGATLSIASANEMGGRVSLARIEPSSRPRPVQATAAAMHAIKASAFWTNAEARL